MDYCYCNRKNEIRSKNQLDDDIWSFLAVNSQISPGEHYCCFKYFVETKCQLLNFYTNNSDPYTLLIGIIKLLIRHIEDTGDKDVTEAIVINIRKKLFFVYRFMVNYAQRFKKILLCYELHKLLVCYCNLEHRLLEEKSKSYNIKMERQILYIVGRILDYTTINTNINEDSTTTNIHIATLLILQEIKYKYKTDLKIFESIAGKIFQKLNLLDQINVFVQDTPILDMNKLCQLQELKMLQDYFKNLKLGMYPFDEETKGHQHNITNNCANLTTKNIDSKIHIKNLEVYNFGFINNEYFPKYSSESENCLNSLASWKSICQNTTINNFDSSTIYEISDESDNDDSTISIRKNSFNIKCKKNICRIIDSSTNTSNNNNNVEIKKNAISNKTSDKQNVSKTNRNIVNHLDENKIQEQMIYLPSQSQANISNIVTNNETTNCHCNERKMGSIKNIPIKNEDVIVIEDDHENEFIANNARNSFIHNDFDIRKAENKKSANKRSIDEVVDLGRASHEERFFEHVSKKRKCLSRNIAENIYVNSECQPNTYNLSKNSTSDKVFPKQVIEEGVVCILNEQVQVIKIKKGFPKTPNKESQQCNRESPHQIASNACISKQVSVDCENKNSLLQNSRNIGNIYNKMEVTGCINKQGHSTEKEKVFNHSVEDVHQINEHVASKYIYTENQPPTDYKCVNSRCDNYNSVKAGNKRKSSDCVIAGCSTQDSGNKLRLDKIVFAACVKYPKIMKIVTDRFIALSKNATKNHSCNNDCCTSKETNIEDTIDVHLKIANKKKSMIESSVNEVGVNTDSTEDVALAKSKEAYPNLNSNIDIKAKLSKNVTDRILADPVKYNKDINKNTPIKLGNSILKPTTLSFNNNEIQSLNNHNQEDHSRELFSKEKLTWSNNENQVSNTKVIAIPNCDINNTIKNRINKTPDKNVSEKDAVVIIKDKGVTPEKIICEKNISKSVDVESRFCSDALDSNMKLSVHGSCSFGTEIIKQHNDEIYSSNVENKFILHTNDTKILEYCHKNSLNGNIKDCTKKIEKSSVKNKLLNDERNNQQKKLIDEVYSKHYSNDQSICKEVTDTDKKIIHEKNLEEQGNNQQHNFVYNNTCTDDCINNQLLNREVHDVEKEVMHREIPECLNNTQLDKFNAVIEKKIFSKDFMNNQPLVEEIEVIKRQSVHQVTFENQNSQQYNLEVGTHDKPHLESFIDNKCLDRDENEKSKHIEVLEDSRNIQPIAAYNEAFSEHSINQDFDKGVQSVDKQIEYNYDEKNNQDHLEDVICNKGCLKYCVNNEHLCKRLENSKKEVEHDGSLKILVDDQKNNLEFSVYNKKCSHSINNQSSNNEMKNEKILETTHPVETLVHDDVSSENSNIQHANEISEIDTETEFTIFLNYLNNRDDLKKVVLQNMLSKHSNENQYLNKKIKNTDSNFEFKENHEEFSNKQDKLNIVCNETFLEPSINNQYFKQNDDKQVGNKEVIEELDNNQHENLKYVNDEVLVDHSVNNRNFDKEIDTVLQVEYENVTEGKCFIQQKQSNDSEDKVLLDHSVNHKPFAKKIVHKVIVEELSNSQQRNLKENDEISMDSSIDNQSLAIEIENINKVAVCKEVSKNLINNVQKKLKDVVDDNQFLDKAIKKLSSNQQVHLWDMDNKNFLGHKEMKDTNNEVENKKEGIEKLHTNQQENFKIAAENKIFLDHSAKNHSFVKEIEYTIEQIDYNIEKLGNKMQENLKDIDGEILVEHSVNKIEKLSNNQQEKLISAKSNEVFSDHSVENHYLNKEIIDIDKKIECKEISEASNNNQLENLKDVMDDQIFLDQSINDQLLVKEIEHINKQAVKKGAIEKRLNDWQTNLKDLDDTENDLDHSVKDYSSEKEIEVMKQIGLKEVNELSNNQHKHFKVKDNEIFLNHSAINHSLGKEMEGIDNKVEHNQVIGKLSNNQQEKLKNVENNDTFFENFVSLTKEIEHFDEQVVQKGLVEKQWDNQQENLKDFVDVEIAVNHSVKVHSLYKEIEVIDKPIDLEEVNELNNNRQKNLKVTDCANFLENSVKNHSLNNKIENINEQVVKKQVIDKRWNSWQENLKDIVDTMIVLDQSVKDDSLDMELEITDKQINHQEVYELCNKQQKNLKDRDYNIFLENSVQNHLLEKEIEGTDIKVEHKQITEKLSDTLQENLKGALANEIPLDHSLNNETENTIKQIVQKGVIEKPWNNQQENLENIIDAEIFYDQPVKVHSLDTEIKVIDKQTNCKEVNELSNNEQEKLKVMDCEMFLENSLNKETEDTIEQVIQKGVIEKLWNNRQENLENIVAEISFVKSVKDHSLDTEIKVLDKQINCKEVNELSNNQQEKLKVMDCEIFLENSLNKETEDTIEQVVQKGVIEKPWNNQQENLENIVDAETFFDQSVKDHSLNKHIEVIHKQINCKGINELSNNQQEKLKVMDCEIFLENSLEKEKGDADIKVEQKQVVEKLSNNQLAKLKDVEDEEIFFHHFVKNQSLVKQIKNTDVITVNKKVLENCSKYKQDKQHSVNKQSLKKEIEHTCKEVEYEELLEDVSNGMDKLEKFVGEETFSFNSQSLEKRSDIDKKICFKKNFEDLENNQLDEEQETTAKSRKNYNLQKSFVEMHCRSNIHSEGINKSTTDDTLKENLSFDEKIVYNFHNYSNCNESSLNLTKNALNANVNDISVQIKSKVKDMFFNEEIVKNPYSKIYLECNKRPGGMVIHQETCLEPLNEVVGNHTCNFNSDNCNQHVKHFYNKRALLQNPTQLQQFWRNHNMSIDMNIDINEVYKKQQIPEDEYSLNREVAEDGLSINCEAYDKKHNEQQSINTLERNNSECVIINHRKKIYYEKPEKSLEGVLNTVLRNWDIWKLINLLHHVDSIFKKNIIGKARKPIRILNKQEQIENMSFLCKQQTVSTQSVKYKIKQLEKDIPNLKNKFVYKIKHKLDPTSLKNKVSNIIILNKDSNIVKKCVKNPYLILEELRLDFERKQNLGVQNIEKLEFKLKEDTSEVLRVKIISSVKKIEVKIPRKIAHCSNKLTIPDNYPETTNHTFKVTSQQLPIDNICIIPISGKQKDVINEDAQIHVTSANLKIMDLCEISKHDKTLLINKKDEGGNLVLKIFDSEVEYMRENKNLRKESRNFLRSSTYEELNEGKFNNEFIENYINNKHINIKATKNRMCKKSIIKRNEIKVCDYSKIIQVKNFEILNIFPRIENIYFLKLIKQFVQNIEDAICNYNLRMETNFLINFQNEKAVETSISLILMNINSRNISKTAIEIGTNELPIYKHQKSLELAARPREQKRVKSEISSSKIDSKRRKFPKVEKSNVIIKSNNINIVELNDEFNKDIKFSAHSDFNVSEILLNNETKILHKQKFIKDTERIKISKMFSKVSIVYVHMHDYSKDISIKSPVKSKAIDINKKRKNIKSIVKYKKIQNNVSTTLSKDNSKLLVEKKCYFPTNISENLPKLQKLKTAKQLKSTDRINVSELYRKNLSQLATKKLKGSCKVNLLSDVYKSPLKKTPLLRKDKSKNLTRYKITASKEKSRDSLKIKLRVMENNPLTLTPLEVCVKEFEDNVNADKSEEANIKSSKINIKDSKHIVLENNIQVSYDCDNIHASKDGVESFKNNMKTLEYNTASMEDNINVPKVSIKYSEDNEKDFADHIKTSKGNLKLKFLKHDSQGKPIKYESAEISRKDMVKHSKEIPPLVMERRMDETNKYCKYASENRIFKPNIKNLLNSSKSLINGRKEIVQLIDDQAEEKKKNSSINAEKLKIYDFKEEEEEKDTFKHIIPRARTQCMSEKNKLCGREKQIPNRRITDKDAFPKFNKKPLQVVTKISKKNRNPQKIINRNKIQAVTIKEQNIQESVSMLNKDKIIAIKEGESMNVLNIGTNKLIHNNLKIKGNGNCSKKKIIMDKIGTIKNRSSCGKSSIHKVAKKELKKYKDEAAKNLKIVNENNEFEDEDDEPLSIVRLKILAEIENSKGEQGSSLFDKNTLREKAALTDEKLPDNITLAFKRETHPKEELIFERKNQILEPVNKCKRKLINVENFVNKKSKLIVEKKNEILKHDGAAKNQSMGPENTEIFEESCNVNMLLTKTIENVGSNQRNIVSTKKDVKLLGFKTHDILLPVDGKNKSQPSEPACENEAEICLINKCLVYQKNRNNKVNITNVSIINKNNVKVKTLNSTESKFEENVINPSISKVIKQGNSSLLSNEDDTLLSNDLKILKVPETLEIQERKLSGKFSQFTIENILKDKKIYQPEQYKQSLNDCVQNKYQIEKLEINMKINNSDDLKNKSQFSNKNKINVLKNQIEKYVKEYERILLSGSKEKSIYIKKIIKKIENALNKIAFMISVRQVTVTHVNVFTLKDYNKYRTKHPAMFLLQHYFYTNFLFRNVSNNAMVGYDTLLNADVIGQEDITLSKDAEKKFAKQGLNDLNQTSNDCKNVSCQNVFQIFNEEINKKIQLLYRIRSLKSIIQSPEVLNLIINKITFVKLYQLEHVKIEKRLLVEKVEVLFFISQLRLFIILNKENVVRKFVSNLTVIKKILASVDKDHNGLSIKQTKSTNSSEMCKSKNEPHLVILNGFVPQQFTKQKHCIQFLNLADQANGKLISQSILPANLLLVYDTTNDSLNLVLYQNVDEEGFLVITGTDSSYHTICDPLLNASVNLNEYEHILNIKESTLSEMQTKVVDDNLSYEIINIHDSIENTSIDFQLQEQIIAEDTSTFDSNLYQTDLKVEVLKYEKCAQFYKEYEICSKRQQQIASVEYMCKLMNFFTNIQNLNIISKQDKLSVVVEEHQSDRIPEKKLEVEQTNSVVEVNKDKQKCMANPDLLINTQKPTATSKQDQESLVNINKTSISKTEPTSFPSTNVNFDVACNSSRTLLSASKSPDSVNANNIIEPFIQKSESIVNETIIQNKLNNVNQTKSISSELPPVLDLSSTAQNFPECTTTNDIIDNVKLRKRKPVDYSSVASLLCDDKSDSLALQKEESRTDNKSKHENKESLNVSNSILTYTTGIFGNYRENLLKKKKRKYDKEHMNVSFDKLLQERNVNFVKSNCSNNTDKEELLKSESYSRNVEFDEIKKKNQYSNYECRRGNATLQDFYIKAGYSRMGFQDPKTECMGLKIKPCKLGEGSKGLNTQSSDSVIKIQHFGIDSKMEPQDLRIEPRSSVVESEDLRMQLPCSPQPQDLRIVSHNSNIESVYSEMDSLRLQAELKCSNVELHHSKIQVSKSLSESLMTNPQSLKTNYNSLNTGPQKSVIQHQTSKKKPRRPRSLKTTSYEKQESHYIKPQHHVATTESRVPSIKPLIPGLEPYLANIEPLFTNSQFRLHVSNAHTFAGNYLFGVDSALHTKPIGIARPMPRVINTVSFPSKASYAKNEETYQYYPASYFDTNPSYSYSSKDINWPNHSNDSRYSAYPLYSNSNRHLLQRLSGNRSPSNEQNCRLSNSADFAWRDAMKRKFPTMFKDDIVFQTSKK